MEIKINKDIRTYSESFFFGLTLRQSVFMLLAIAAAVTSYLCLKGRLGTETVSWVCILCAVPFAALGFVNYHGLTAEKLLKVLFRSAAEPRRLTVKTYDTEEDVLIHDADGEYVQLVQALGVPATIVNVAAGGKDRLNAMCMVDGYGEGDPKVAKSEFVLSLLEQIDKQHIGTVQKSIIDRCMENVIRKAENDSREVTLCDLREELTKQPEKEAKRIALMLELYTTGSLNIFGKESNVDLSKRVVVFDTHNLSPQLKSTGLLMITDTMMNRVAANWKKGKRTHIFIDEFHTVFENEYSAKFFNSAWRQFRKRNAYPTAITQNVEYLLDSVDASTMLSNSELVVMLNQAPADREKLARLYNISEEQQNYIRNAEPGSGLIKYGSTMVPFVNKIPADTKIYGLMTTKPGEGRFGGKSLT